jgi:hypothetical protein
VRQRNQERAVEDAVRGDDAVMVLEREGPTLEVGHLAPGLEHEE